MNKFPSPNKAEQTQLNLQLTTPSLDTGLKAVHSCTEQHRVLQYLWINTSGKAVSDRTRHSLRFWIILVGSLLTSLGYRTEVEIQKAPDVTIPLSSAEFLHILL